MLEFKSVSINLPRLLAALIAQIPPGRVATCGTLAEALGSRQAAKWVGYQLLHHRHEEGCACHRVVRAGGHVGGFVEGIEAKMALLAREGVFIAKNRIDLAREGVFIAKNRIDLARHEMVSFAGPRPLEELRQRQEELAPCVELLPLEQSPELVAGLDVSYTSSGWGVAAYALVELATGRLVWSTTYTARATFPYIPSFLAYRELPLLLGVLAAARAAGRHAEVLLVDGSGILHPRRAGSASLLGLAAELPTLGVTKKLLCGKVLAERSHGDWAEIREQGILLGGALAKGRAGKPLYVSPGHLIDVPSAAGLTLKLLGSHSLPEPIYWADRLSRSEARKIRPGHFASCDAESSSGF